MAAGSQTMLVKDLIEVITEERPNENHSVLSNSNFPVVAPVKTTPHGNPIKEQLQMAGFVPSSSLHQNH